MDSIGKGKVRAIKCETLVWNGIHPWVWCAHLEGVRQSDREERGKRSRHLGWKNNHGGDSDWGKNSNGVCGDDDSDYNDKCVFVLLY